MLNVKYEYECECDTACHRKYQNKSSLTQLIDYSAAQSLRLTTRRRPQIALWAANKSVKPVQTGPRWNQLVDHWLVFGCCHGSHPLSTLTVYIHMFRWVITEAAHLFVFLCVSIISTNKMHQINEEK